MFDFTKIGDFYLIADSIPTKFTLPQSSATVIFSRSFSFNRSNNPFVKALSRCFEKLLLVSIKLKMSIVGRK